MKQSDFPSSLFEWLDYIGKIHERIMDLGLERMQSFLSTLHLNSFSCPVVMVSGTNGKGSVVKTLEQIYLASGLSVAAYTSPHLLDFRERLCINGALLSESVWKSAFEVIEEQRRHLNISLSFFEFTTLAVFWICQKTQKLDLIILEVGLGGRLDAVNSIDPTVSVITNVDIDHVEWLGDNREKIGFEKAGIFRTGKRAVCGDLHPPHSLLLAAKEKNVPLFCLGSSYGFNEQADRWEWYGPDRVHQDLPLPALKLQNVATALMVTTLLDFPLSLPAIKEGIQKAILPGRYEKHQKHCSVILDVAHNPQSALYLLTRFQQEKVMGRRLAVVGMLRDKDIRGSLIPFIKTIDAWYVGTLEGARGAEGIELQALLTENGVKCCYNFTSVTKALQEALLVSHPEDSILVFGSFHTVAEAKAHIYTNCPTCGDSIVSQKSNLIIK